MHLIDHFELNQKLVLINQKTNEWNVSQFSQLHVTEYCCHHELNSFGKKYFLHARYQVPKSKHLYIKYVQFFVYHLYLNKAIKHFFKQTHSFEGRAVD